jgi:hypothetical protein
LLRGLRGVRPLALALAIGLVAACGSSEGTEPAAPPGASTDDRPDPSRSGGVRGPFARATAARGQLGSFALEDATVGTDGAIRIASG